MALEILPILGLGLVLGIRHGFDADHLLAVGGLLDKSDSMKQAVGFGLSWSAGHVSTAGLLTIVFFMFKERYLSGFLAQTELLTGVMLVLIGVWAVVRSIRLVRGKGTVGMFGGRLSYKGLFGVGVVQGLASNDELLLLLAATIGIQSIWTILMGIGLFGIGVSVGMAAFSGLLAVPLLKTGNVRILHGLPILIGFISMVYGFTIVLGMV